MSVSYVDGDVLAYVTSGGGLSRILCHQTNCSSNDEAGGIAKAIFDRWPAADDYRNGVNPHMPMGSVHFVPVSEDLIIANMFCQYFRGKARDGRDSASARVTAFSAALDVITRKVAAGGVDEVVFPYHIGCGLAGGDWSQYSAMIESFAGRVCGSVKVVVCKLQDGAQSAQKNHSPFPSDQP